MSSLFCCRRPRTISPTTPDGRPPRTLQIDSVESVALPSFNIPHRSEPNNAIDDEQALRDIFTKPSSVRGYQATNVSHQPCHNRFNVDFELERRSPTRSSNSRLGALGHAVKQRLSESRLSKESSKMSLNPMKVQGLAEHTDMGGASYRSTGITDLLMSRTASEGGYDSDAKDIHTPEMKQTSNPGSLSISPEYIKKLLLPTDYSPKRAASRSSRHHGPSTAEHNGGPIQSSAKAGHESRLSVSAPERSSSLNPDYSSTRRTGHSVENTAETSAPGAMPTMTTADDQEKIATTDSRKAKSHKVIHSDSHQLSDKSSIHLTDLRISQRLASTSLMPMSSPASTDFGSSAEYDAVADMSSYVTHYTGSPLDRSGVTSMPSHLMPRLSADGSASRDELQALPRSGAEMLRRKSGLSNEVELPWRMVRQPSATGRFPCFIAREHNRKPSDPKTRRLFEEAKDESKLHPKWKSVTSASSARATIKSAKLSRDDASSHYGKEGELPPSDAASLAEVEIPEQMKNQNSLAMPGWRASGALGHRYVSIGQFSTAEEASWLRDCKDKGGHSRKASENALGSDGMSFQSLQTDGQRRSMSKESKFTEEDLDETPTKRRKFISTTEANERMSEISTSVFKNRKHGRMSEIEQHTLPKADRVRADSSAIRSTNSGWLSQGKRSGWNYGFVNRSPSRQVPGLQAGNGSERLRRETAADVWERAFRKAEFEQVTATSATSMLNVPLWGDPAKRRRSKSSASERQDGGSLRLDSVASTRRESRSDTDLNPFSLDDHQALCAEARKPLPSIRLGWTGERSENDGPRPASTEFGPKKRRVLEFRRYTYTSANNNSQSAEPTPAREYLSWTRLPSHTRAERSGSAGVNDGVQVRDFSPPTDEVEKTSEELSLTKHKNKSAADLRSPSPGSWRLRSFGRRRKKKAKSMTFGKDAGTPKWKLPKRSSIWHWKTLYRSQSSDLRRLRAGHRSSVTLGREVEYPELEIPAGLGEIVFHGLATATPTPRVSNNRARTTKVLTDDDATIGSTELRRVAHATDDSSTPLRQKEKRDVSTGFDGIASPEKFSLHVALMNKEEGEAFMQAHANQIATSDSDLSSQEQDGGTVDNSSWVSLTGSNAYATGDWGLSNQSVQKLHVEDSCPVPRDLQLTSSELRDSTVDFKEALIKSEKKSGDDLLKMALGVDGNEDEEDPDQHDTKYGHDIGEQDMGHTEFGTPLKRCPCLMKGADGGLA